MEQFANDVGISLLAATPFLVLAKLVHALATGRLSLASRGSRGARAESVAWLLLGALDAHTLALWSSVTNQPEDLCAQYRPDLGENVYITGGHFLEYPVSARCVWPGGESVTITPWPLNVVTALFLAAAIAVAVLTAVRARQNTAR